MKINSLFTIIVFILYISLASGKGIIINLNNITFINKTIEQAIPFTFTLTNTESFDFYNITFETPSGIEIDRIDNILALSTINASGRIIGDSDISGEIKASGLFTTQVGASNQTYNITINFNNGFSECDKSLIKGDKVVWINEVNDEIVLRNSITGINFAAIPIAGAYNTNFDTPSILSYYALRRGYIFTPLCTLTILNDNGLVHNPEYDGKINVSIKLNLPYTNISYILLQNNYTISIFQSQDGLISITNIGNITAKNIKFTGEWFSFNNNNFDLLASQTRVISYTITPVVSSVNDTNKYYNKSIIINGNFENKILNFSIYIPYSDLLTTQNSSTNYQSLIDIIKSYCISHPQESFCLTTPKTVYVYGNGSSQVTMNFTQEQVKGLFDYFFELGDGMKDNNKFNNEKFDSITTRMNDISINMNNLTSSFNILDSQRKESFNVYFFILIAAALIILVSLMTFILVFYKKYRLKKELLRW